MTLQWRDSLIFRGESNSQNSLALNLIVQTRLYQCLKVCFVVLLRKSCTICKTAKMRGDYWVDFPNQDWQSLNCDYDVVHSVWEKTFQMVICRQDSCGGPSLGRDLHVLDKIGFQQQAICLSMLNVNVLLMAYSGQQPIGRYLIFNVQLWGVGSWSNDISQWVNCHKIRHQIIN